MLEEPVAGEPRHLVEGAWFGEEVGRGGHDRERFRLRAQTLERLLIELQDGRVEAADD